MNKSTKIVLFSVILLLIAGIILYPYLKKMVKKENNTEQAPAPVSTGRAPLNVNVKIIGEGRLVDVIRATGNLIPDEEVDLTFETSGKITDIFFKEGSSVKKGQLLAKINDKPLQAELQKLEAQLPLAQERVFRQKSLLEKDAVSQEAYEQVTTELEKLNADIELAKARIAQTELRAPFDGNVGLRNVSEGAYTSPTTVITTLTKIIPLKIEFSVNERYVNDIAPGTKITFRTDLGLTTYEASVFAVESRVNMATRSLTTRALYPNSGGKLKPGGMASIEIRLNEIDNAITVPNESVIAELGRDIAYIYSDGKAKRVEVIKGIRTESNLQILEGLNPGDTLIVTGIMQLRESLPVQINTIVE